MTKIRSRPCESCPYKLGVPSGVWSFEEYEKLRDYDHPTFDQPLAAFACHATPEALCHGWAVVHSSRGHDHELLALRLCGSPPIPEPGVAMWESGNAAADHGQKEIEAPSTAAVETVERLTRKFPRLVQDR